MTSLPASHGRRRHGRSRAREHVPAAAAGRATPATWLSALLRRASAFDVTRSWIRPLDWEGWLAVLALLHGASAFDFVLAPADATAPASTAIWLLLYIAVFGLLWYRHRLHWLPWLLRHQPLLCAVLAIAAASWFWSIAPEFTWKRVVHLLGTTLIGIYIGYRFAPRTLMVILFYVFAILIVGSVLFALLVPEYGHTEGKDTWTGLTGNRNHLGFIAAIAAVFFLVGTLFDRIPLMLGIGLALLSVLALAMTGSATSMVVLPVGLLSVAIFMLSKRIRAPSILTLILLLVGGAGAAIFVATTEYLYDFTELLGRDATFTNRTDIWVAAWRVTLDRPWLGWGYGTLWWPHDESAFIQRQLLSASWMASHAHNGFLTVASELGLPAGIAAVACVLVALVQAARGYVRRASPFNLFAIAFFLMFIVENFAETWIFHHRDMFWIFFLAVAVAVQRGAASRHEPKPSPTRVRRRYPDAPAKGLRTASAETHRH